MARVATVVVPKPEFDALVAEVEQLQSQVKHLTIDYDDARDRVFKAETELERLRAAVDFVIESWDWEESIAVCRKAREGGAG